MCLTSLSHRLVYSVNSDQPILTIKGYADMKINSIYKNMIITGSIAIGTTLVTGCSSDDTTLPDSLNSDTSSSLVRIIHASADAPPVNIKLDNAIAVPALDYPNSTGFVNINSGTYDVAVDAIVPGGNLEVITVNDLDLIQDQRYTIVAIGDTANIKEFVAAETASSPAADEVGITVLHAATAAGNVDVYVTAPGEDLTSLPANFTFDFNGQFDAGALPAGPYQIRVVANGDITKTAVYDSGTVDLSGFAGQKLLLLAVNTVNSTTQLASPVKLVAYTDSAQVELLDTRTNSGARVVHLSPDAGTAASGPVEVFASSSALPSSPTELITSISYKQSLPGTDSFADVPAGDYIFDVAPDNAGIGSSVHTSPAPVTLSTGAEYTVIASAYVLTSPAFSLLATQDNNRSIVTQASVKVIHGSPLAGTVDVFVTPAGAYTKEQVEGGMAGDPLLDDFTFGTITDYVNVVPGDYDIRVVTNSGMGTAAINVEGFNLAAGSVSTVIAHEPKDNGPATDFGLVVLTN